MVQSIFMPRQKYKQYCDDMLEIHHGQFEKFKDVHDKFVLEPEKWKKEFNKEGEKVLAIIRRYENQLCGKSEGGRYGKFSSQLADKFWGEIRARFPKIDFVGIE